MVWKALDERKLNYNAVVSYLQYNRPVLFAGDAEEFLFNCFDANGKFTRSAAAWMLWKVWWRQMYFFKKERKLIIVFCSVWGVQAW